MRSARTSFSLVELLICLAIIALLMAIIYPLSIRVRDKAKAAQCASNLHSIGQAVMAYASGHADALAPSVRQRDFNWASGEQIGWDIQVGRWAGVSGGSGTTWTCPEGGTAYMANARATGLDTRYAPRPGALHTVTLRQWDQPARLIFAYDLQVDLLESLYAHARDPQAADLSDEMHSPWPRFEANDAIPAFLDRLGPHADAYGVIFGDGHAQVDTFNGVMKALYWSGPRWWPSKYVTVRSPHTE